MQTEYKPWIGSAEPSGNKLLQLINLRNNFVNVPEFVGITSFPVSLDPIIDFFKSEGITHVSVRSAPEVSLPGMLDTVLNVPIEEIEEHVSRVFDSINNPRAQRYLRGQGLETPRINVVIQRMVTVTGENDGAGVAYTHNLQTAEDCVNGVYLPGVQGDSVVDNSSMCLSLDEFPHRANLLGTLSLVGSGYHWPQEVEFTYIGSEIFVLQTRRCHLSLIPHLRLMKRVSSTLPDSVVKEELSMLPAETLAIRGEPIYKGVGLAGGRVIISGPSEVLIKEFVSNEDIASIASYKAVISSTGNLGSHPVTVCRNLGVPYVLVEDLPTEFPAGGIAVDGYSGGVYNADCAKTETITHENYEQFI